jgi:hypothetical protein
LAAAAGELFVLAKRSISRFDAKSSAITDLFWWTKETTNMGKSSIIGTWVGIFVFIAITLGSLEHAARTDPSGVDTARVAVRGIVIPPFN